MPNIKSAKKALRQSERKRVVNIKRKTAYKKATKDYIKILSSGGDPEKSKNQLGLAYKALDKAARSKTIKRGKANRLKSRLAKRLKP